MKTNPKFINVDDYLVIRQVSKEEGATCSHWFLMDEKEYLLKIEDLFYCYLEIFCSLILKNIDISTVNYELAKYHGFTGVITPNYNQNHYDTINLRTILNKYEEYLKANGKNISPNNFCYEKLKKIISWYYPNESEEVIKNLYDGIFTNFMSSIFLGNTDLNSKNIEIYNPEHPIISPCYDYEKSFRIGFNFLDISPYCLKYASCYQNDFGRDFETPEKTIQKFLKFGERKHIEEFKEKLESLKELNIKTITSQIEYETESIIPSNINKRLVMLYEQNIRKVNKIVRAQK